MNLTHYCCIEQLLYIAYIFEHFSNFWKKVCLKAIWMIGDPDSWSSDSRSSTVSLKSHHTGCLTAHYNKNRELLVTLKIVDLVVTNGVSNSVLFMTSYKDLWNFRNSFTGRNPVTSGYWNGDLMNDKYSTPSLLLIFYR